MPEFLRCGGFYFAVAVRHSQLHVGGSLVPLPHAGAVPALTWSDTFKPKL